MAEAGNREGLPREPAEALPPLFEILEDRRIVQAEEVRRGIRRNEQTAVLGQQEGDLPRRMSRHVDDPGIPHGGEHCPVAELLLDRDGVHLLRNRAHPRRGEPRPEPGRRGEGPGSPPLPDQRGIFTMHGDGGFDPLPEGRGGAGVIEMQVREDNASYFLPAPADLSEGRHQEIRLAGSTAVDNGDVSVRIDQVGIHESQSDAIDTFCNSFYAHMPRLLYPSPPGESFPAPGLPVLGEKLSLSGVLWHRSYKILYAPSRMELQLALDYGTADEALALLAQVHDQIDIAEVGTPLVIREGVSVLRRIRAAFPALRITADLKIMDAGAYETAIACEAGADMVTVLALADDATIRGAVEEARRHGSAVMVDMIGVSVPERRATEIHALEAHYLCLHTAVDSAAAQAGAGASRGTELARVRAAAPRCRIAVAGGISPENIRETVAAGPDLVIVGSGLSRSADPAAAAATIRGAMAEAEGGR